MRLLPFFLIVLFIPSLTFSQDASPTKAINGTYHLLEAERGVETKLFEFGEHNGVKLLAIAACEKCMPAVYTYKADESKELGRTVFFNATGLYVFRYDEESFVMIMIDPNADVWTDFYFSNFYSKNKIKVDSMSKQKLKDFIIKISN